ncbi:hypothetical protein ACOMHN_020734 [Nucella lapillus]
MTTWWLWCPVVVLGLLLHVSLMVHAGYEHTCYLANRNRPHPKGLCGSNLPNTLRQVCQHLGRGYAGGLFGKRANNDIGMDAGAEEQEEGEQGEKLRGVLMSKRQAMAYLEKRKRLPDGFFGLSHLLMTKRVEPQGITCECCYNRCNLNELLQYCN